MDEERQVELDCIAAIFPELILDAQIPFSASIELPVNPRTPVKVIFPADAGRPTGQTSTQSHLETSSPQNDAPTNNAADDVEIHNIAYLPALQLRITLPQGYPEEQPPKFELSTSPAWLSRAYLDELQVNGKSMWEEAGRSVVVFGYIDSLRQAAENGFGFAQEGKLLEIPQDYKISVLDYDIKAAQDSFGKETFDCGVCLDPKKGSVCHRMIDCGHVFCVQCLQDFYNNAISEGDLVSVRCLAPDCAKKRAEGQGGSAKSTKKKIQLSPGELLQIPLELDVVTRYVKLKHKATLESDKNTIYCPRKWCQGAARSKKHRKPDGLEVVDSSDDESDTEKQGTKTGFIAGKDLLSVCEDCSFAFCSRCLQGWHGEFKLCTPKRDRSELTEEEKASLEYLQLHTTPCPTCAAPAQKTFGCNHMICFKCNSHFCYLCSAWLEPGNPYKHYNLETTGCYMRLWELEGGDGDDVGIGFAGGVQPVPQNAVNVAEAVPEAAEDEPVLEVEIATDEAARPAVDVLPGEQAGQVIPQAEPVQQLEREGPLVLRINQVPRQPVPPAAAAVPERPQPARRNREPPVQRRPPNRNAEPQGVGMGQRGAAPGRRVVLPVQPAPRHQAFANQVGNAAEQVAAQQAWVQRFVEMALNDEEDQIEWDSDDELDGAWEIPVR